MANYLSDADLDRFRAIFKLFDKNNDDKITADELGTVLRTMNQNPTEKDIQDILKEADVDKSGAIEWNEFITIIPKKLKQIQKEEEEKELRAAFKVFDADNSGNISVEELRKAMETYGEKLTTAQAQDLVNIADTNKDGVIDINEFVAWLMSH